MEIYFIIEKIHGRQKSTFIEQLCSWYAFLAKAKMLLLFCMKFDYILMACVFCTVHIDCNLTPTAGLTR